ncbi:SLOG family protein [Gehongia tenuis]|uniref:DUF1273 family protein n=1 Tax=Gehongia tenuis TaxID=2763655 RepID=A0A926D1K0_9FIRM|nr:SLOG family protein [Gehongia tenuis]MBC8530695.1 DUF1273 family protein [Gehongia tenuis]
MNRTTCCFTGHRPEKLKIGEAEVRAALKREIEAAAAEGFTTFITGMARGVDLWAAEEVLELKSKNPALRLIAALPFPRFEAGWSPAWQARYRRVLKGADQRFVISPAFSYAAFQKRNRWMVDRSGRVIAVYGGGRGGTLNTLQYARARGVPVRILPG